MWSKVYKRDLIGNLRFKEDINYAEDKNFNDKIKPSSSTYIEKQIYLYNYGREESLSKRGVKKTLIIVFTFITLHYITLAIIALIIYLILKR